MAEKIAFAYAHGGSVFDSASHDGLNERGRNLVNSIKSAIASGPDKVFVSEAVYPDAKSQFALLIKSGRFAGLERFIDFQAYQIAKNVKFPKNYLMNRCAQRANGFFGIVFTDSDVIFQPSFPQRAAENLKMHDFLQPEYIMYLDPEGRDKDYLETTMKRASVSHELYKNNLSYLEGMPGMVNVANRDKFLSIGGFSQAVSGVNFEDIEYQIRLKILSEKTSFMHDEWCRHIHHPRSAIIRQSENLPAMFFENANFLNWWIDYFLQIRGTHYDKANFDRYMRIITESLRANERLNGPYSSETGTITPGYDPSARYRGFAFGQAEPYTEYGTKEEKIDAIINAAKFWQLSYEEIIHINPSKSHGVSPEDVRWAEKSKIEGEKSKNIDKEIEETLDGIESDIDRDILEILEQPGTENTVDRTIMQILAEM